jgi:hypothetical protein
MTKTPVIIDSVRPSRDGHEYHEAWAARLSLRLVLRLDGLVGIAMEGLSHADELKASRETVDIADLTLYYGKGTTFEVARAVVITQAKYSVAKARLAFRAADADKTIKKFAKTYREYRKKYGQDKVTAKLSFEIVTNRPICMEFLRAVHSLASRKKLRGKAKKQARQFQKASGLAGEQLREFAMKFILTGSSGSLKENKQILAQTVVDWSAARDSKARSRLGELRKMVRDKAGSEGNRDKIIRRTDVFAALEIADVDDLLPFPASFPEVGVIVPREQLDEVARIIPSLEKPLVIHAEGGTGKTVFLNSLITLLRVNHECLIFDCFGGGAYRSADDGRHRPGRSLLHIVNQFACLGLCDPMLPDNENTESLLRAFRHRLDQCVATIRKNSPTKQLLLFIDAADNAGMQAEDKRQDAFPKTLLENLEISGPIAGVQIIVSCRTHRRDYARGTADCHEIQLRDFTKSETREFLRARMPDLTEDQFLVAHARSNGNPRVLEHLVRERGLLEASEIKKPLIAADLVKAQVDKALKTAILQGYKQSQIDAFLAGLAKLPPPLPQTEYAASLGMEPGAVESFASDLAPLLERTKHGLIFRDEPTETYITQTYVAKHSSLQLLKKNLLKNQSLSVYAAKALPGLLAELDDGKSLFKLAFDETMPKSVTSSVGKQKIRYMRIKAAVLHAAQKQNYNFLVRLLVELSTLAAVDQRGADYLADNPDFVVLSEDSEAQRRLTERRSDWPGRRYARISIALALSQDVEEALRSAYRAAEWIDYHVRQGDDYRRQHRLEPLDVASIPFCHVALNRPADACRTIGGWYDWFAFEVARHLGQLFSAAKVLHSFPVQNVTNFLEELDLQLGVLAGTVAFFEIDEKMRVTLIKKLAGTCAQKQSVKIQDDFGQHRSYQFQDGLFKAAAAALHHGLKKEALSILNVIPRGRTGLWVFFDRFGTHDPFPFFAEAVLGAIAAGGECPFHRLLPQELSGVGVRVKGGLTLAEFQKAICAEIESIHQSEMELPDEKKTFGSDKKSESVKFVNERLGPLHEMAVCFSAMVSSDAEKRKAAIPVFIGLWEKLRKNRDYRVGPAEVDYLFSNLGRRVLEFCLWADGALDEASAEKIRQSLVSEHTLSDSSLVEIIATFARNPSLHQSAGEMAVAAKSSIEKKDDVPYRASMFAQLAKAILPASAEDARSYFQSGLDQMDAIGSGDNEFTDELLGFASSLKGEELEPEDFHTLTNLCELNLYDKGERFAWGDFGRGLARSSGGRSLAKLCRWHDRGSASLNYSLLPYLYSLLDQEKMDPAIVLGLLRLSDPMELWACGTSHFAKLIEKKGYSNGKELIVELIRQFEANNPGFAIPATVEVLGEVSSRMLGADSETARRLTAAASHFDKVRTEDNDRINSHNKTDPEAVERVKTDAKRNDDLQDKILADVNPGDEASLSTALDSAVACGSFDAKRQLLAKARAKVDFSARAKYVEVVANLSNVELFAKIDELQQCKLAWQNSSASLNSTLNKIAKNVLQIHAGDFISHQRFFGSSFRDVAELCGFSEQELILELIRTFAAAEWELPPSVWLEFASITSVQAKQGDSRAAITRLLKSGAAKLSTTVQDGAWKNDIYPSQDETEIAAGMTWLLLGSPSAAGRWRAAHSIRTFARFGKWRVIDALVAKYTSNTAAPFQAPELPFYFFHARLWLLITLARLSLEFPHRLAKHAKLLRTIALDSNEPHILIRHFAAQALLNCENAGGVKLPRRAVIALQKVNHSPFKATKVKKNRADSFYQGRPASVPEPKDNFSLEYDFDKSEVGSVSQLFNVPHWSLNDLITSWVRRYDRKVKSMWDSGGRQVNQDERRTGINSKHQTYGSQLGWHGLHVATGQLLATTPIAIQRYDEENPWPEWWSRQLLSRRDGWWLADGMDPAPLDTQVNLLELSPESVITSDKEKLLRLIRCCDECQDDVVVEGNWQSPDGVSVMISSAYVVPQEAAGVATKLAAESGFSAYLPLPDDHDDFGRTPNKKRKTFTFAVSPSNQSGLDESDPLGDIVAVCRPLFSQETIKFGRLKPTDPFNRAWTDPNGCMISRADAWGSSERNHEEESKSGTRMTCSREFLKTLLSSKQLDLVILIVLRKYEKHYGSDPSNYRHSTAVVHFDKDLKVTFYPGLANEAHKPVY